MTGPTDWRTYDARDALYDPIPQGYEAAFAGIPGQQRSLQWLLSNLPGPGSRILNICCGTGRPVTSALYERRVYGIDISPVMIAAACALVPSARGITMLFPASSTRRCSPSFGGWASLGVE